MSISTELWQGQPPQLPTQNESPFSQRTLAQNIPCTGPIGVTIASPGYTPLVDEAVTRFHAMTGLDVVVLWVGKEPAFAAKLNLDLLIAPRPIVYFDVDLWLLRPFDFTVLAESGQFCAVPDPGAWNPLAFPCIDSLMSGWDRAAYFNSGLFVCDLAQPEIRGAFESARQHLANCHAGLAQTPVDWTDQYFLNWAIQQQPRLLKQLPFAMNFYKLAVDWGSYPHIPREIVGLHAAGIPLEEKLNVLRSQAAVFGTQTSPMLPEATHYYQCCPRHEQRLGGPYVGKPLHPA